ncbi:MAG: hypothetical protein CMC08_09095 [Flavobacteriaceae bacterium]|nr:hypothetical protein [Flavobacteriaceae bacterium]
MPEREKILHKAKLNNNCPVCYTTEGLELSFTQHITEDRFFERANPLLGEKLYCHTCQGQIFPVNWTEDIERVYEYHKKRASPQSHYMKVKPLFYGVILVGIAAIAAIVYFALVR